MNDDLFSYGKGRLLAERGIEAAASAPGADEWIDRARSLARMVCEISGEVCADDLRGSLPPPPSPNVWGSVFRTSCFQWTGKVRQSDLASRHAGLQRVWRLNPETKKKPEP